MTVYVDDTRIKYQRLVMCHMVADSEPELHAAARALGLNPAWYHRGHYNICLSKRAKAVALGAVEITSREAVGLRHKLDVREGMVA